jgi:CYTH domain-containing protein
MNESDYQTEYRRVFLIENLPEPLTRASPHLQFFDNYIKNTRLRLRYVRDPQTKEWTRILQQRFPADENDLRVWKTSKIFLNSEEYQVFEKFEGRELRKNRYFYKAGDRDFEIDVYIGGLWGLHLAKVYFKTPGELQGFEKPDFAVAEVTDNGFFAGENLVEKTFEDVQREFQAHNSKAGA